MGNDQTRMQQTNASTGAAQLTGGPSMGSVVISTDVASTSAPLPTTIQASGGSNPNPQLNHNIPCESSKPYLPHRSIFICFFPLC